MSSRRIKLDVCIKEYVFLITKKMIANLKEFGFISGNIYQLFVCKL